MSTREDCGMYFETIPSFKSSVQVLSLTSNESLLWYQSTANFGFPESSISIVPGELPSSSLSSLVLNHQLSMATRASGVNPSTNVRALHFSSFFCLPGLLTLIALEAKTQHGRKRRPRWAQGRTMGDCRCQSHCCLLSKGIMRSGPGNSITPSSCSWFQHCLKMIPLVLGLDPLQHDKRSLP